MKLLEFHEIANLFPLMEGKEYEELCADIAANGLLDAIWLHPDGSILDGRNRYRACLQTGTEPRFETWRGADELEFVLSKNLHRRHLNESQRAMIAARLVTTTFGSNQYEGRSIDLPIIPQPEAAKMLNVSVPSVKRAAAVQREADPETIESIDRGEVAVSHAYREIRRNERIEEIREKVKSATPLRDIGVFPVIYADPPWQYDHPISDSRRIENQYPTMPIEDICALPINEISASDSIIFLWASTPMLKKGLAVLDAWGFDYRTSMVWVKPSIGPGHWVRQRHELLLIGIRGNIPTPKGSDKPDSVIEAPRTGHSKKPEVMYEIIERIFPTLSKVELFCREPRDGWSAWGNEL